MHMEVDTEHPVIISSGLVKLDGVLHVPKDATGLVLFAHGSGSGRFSTRNQYVATILNKSKFATLLFDLLTSEEEKIDIQTAEFRFDIDLLAERLVDVTKWCSSYLVTHGLPIGYFGASTGGGAALVAAATEFNIVKAVVSRGGRPDLAGDALSYVQAPTLLIVGGNDFSVIELNKIAMTKIHCVKKLEIIPGATHLFEEAGTLDQVARLASSWFMRYLATH